MSHSVLDFKPLDEKVYSPIGRCIYCGSTDALEKEHILPFGLSGTAILLKASCRGCASITGATEQTLLRGSFWPVRIFRNLKSRKKHKDAPSTFPVTIVRDGRDEIVQLAVEKLPILLHFPIFLPPAYISKSGLKAGITLAGLATVKFDRDPGETGQSLGSSILRFNDQQHPVEFARVIAKIGYAFAVAEGATADLDGEPLVVPAIIDRPNDIGQWVGTLTAPHALTRVCFTGSSFITSGVWACFLQKFSSSQIPKRQATGSSLESSSSGRCNRSVERGHPRAIAFGRPFISNVFSLGYLAI